MKQKLYFFTTILMILFMNAGIFAQKKIMYVGHVKLEPSDTFLVDTIAAMGYTVYFVTSTDFKDQSDENVYKLPTTYDTIDAVIFSETLGSSDVINYKTAGYPKPMVLLEGFAVTSTKLGWITDDDANFHQASGNEEKTEDCYSILIENSDHYITEEYYDGDEIVWLDGITYPGVTGFQLDENIPLAIVLAYSKAEALDDFPMLWAIPEGATIISDGSTLKRTVAWGVIMTQDDAIELAGFYSIIKRSLKWVLGEDVGFENVTALFGSVKLHPNPVKDMAKLTFNLSHPAVVSVNVYDMLGKRMSVVSETKVAVGPNEIGIDVSGFCNGVYFYELETGGEVCTGKFCVIK